MTGLVILFAIVFILFFVVLVFDYNHSIIILFLFIHLLLFIDFFSSCAPMTSLVVISFCFNQDYIVPYRFIKLCAILGYVYVQLNKKNKNCF